MKYSFLALILSLAIILNAQTPAQQTPNKNGGSQNGGSSKGGSSSGSSSGAAASGTNQKLEKYAKVKWRKKLKIARKEIGAGSYISAAEYLEDVFKDKPDKSEVLHLLGDVNRLLRDYEAAEKYYKLSLQKNPDAFIDDSYWLGIMQKMNGQYDDAKKTLTDYLKAKLDKGDHNFKNQAKMDIEGIDSAQVILKNPSKVRVDKITGINAVLQDLSPQTLKGNRIMFAQQKTDTAIDNTTAKSDYFASIFTAEKTGKNTYGNKTLMPYPPNEKHANTGNAIMSGDEKTIIYTICHDSLVEGNRSKCKLYRTTKKNALEWNAPEVLKTLDTKDTNVTTTHPAFGVDEQGNNILYFSSNRKGTKGGMDIWYAKMNSDGTFGEVTNAGPEINTAADEVTPFYDFKNKLFYFSSNGHPSIGGLDIFKVSGTPGKWGKVINAGVPINSQADDLYFSLDPSAEKGFEVSNRIGTTSTRGATCCDDIWAVTLVHDIVLKAIYVMRGDPTNTPIEGVDASLYKVNGNNFEFVANSKTTKDPSYFPVKRGTSYKVNGNKEGFWPSIDNLSIAEDESQDTISKIFYLDPIIKIHIKIPNVYFAFDKSNIIDFYKHQIDSVVKVLNDHPAYTLEIQGHTDTMGSDEYNQGLSERRANEVKQFLIKKKKIAENRVVAKWFGRTHPAVPNRLPDGEDDPEGRARNRRVEFNIIPDKPEDAPEIEHTGEVVKQVKTGPGFTYGRKPAPKKK